MFIVKQQDEKLIIECDYRTARQIGMSLAENVVSRIRLVSEISKLVTNSQVVRIQLAVSDKLDLWSKEILDVVGV